MDFFKKQFCVREDNTVYLVNRDLVEKMNEEWLDRLTHVKNMDELYGVQRSILRKFYEIYEYDIRNAEMPDPAVYVRSQKEKQRIMENRIFLHDMILHLANVYMQFHKKMYQKSGRFPEIECRKLAINYAEIYEAAIRDYTDALLNEKLHAITASFVLPSLIEQGLAMDLQSRMLLTGIAELNSKTLLKQELSAEEIELISIFWSQRSGVRFPADEKSVMGKMYSLFIREGILKRSDDNELILTGRVVSCKKGRGKIRTLGSLLNSSYAKEELRPEYHRLLTDIFIHLNIRNSIMHGSGEPFDYLHIGIVAIMLQLLWDIAECAIFKEE